MKENKKIIFVVIIVCLLIGGVAIFQGVVGNREEDVTVSSDGVTIPKMKVSYPEMEGGEYAASMAPFFIYDNRSYRGYDSCEKDLADKYLGTSKGGIDEWTSKDKYVNFTGSSEGKIYSVKGYDPRFMLCMKEEEGTQIYINDNDLTLKKGSELYEDRLKLSGNYEKVQYEIPASGMNEKRKIRTLSSEADNVIKSFVNELNEAAFIRTKDVPMDSGKADDYPTPIYYMYFRMKDGVSINLFLHKGGYVTFPGVYLASVKVDDKVFEELLTFL
ncbi:MAG: hypothetical protein J6I65_01750 [Lachnospiraceae bacterium]|nr:hypothetical protein [Lachnospiraceae bacterium]